MENKEMKRACKLYAAVLFVNIALFVALFLGLQQEEEPQIIREKDQPINLRSSQPIAIITRKKQENGGQEIRP